MLRRYPASGSSSAFVGILYQQTRAESNLAVIINKDKVMSGKRKDDVQRDFLKFTSQHILKVLRNEKSDILEKLLVQFKDRKYQVWGRNSLGVSLWSPEVFWQKLEYIHYNPVKAGLCEYLEDYKYSSARRFYLKNEKDWDFLIHHEE